MYRGSWYMYVVPVIAQHNGMTLHYFYAVYLVQRSCLHRTFGTTELVTLWGEESAGTLGVLDADE